MKKILITSIVLLGFGAGQLLAPLTYAQETNTNATKTQNPDTAAPAKRSTVKTEKDWFDALNLRIDLAQAKAAVLRAKIALEIEKSPERAKQALDDAETHYKKVRKTVSSKAGKQVEKLINSTAAARDAVISAPAKAKNEIDGLIKHTEDQLQEYGEIALDTDEAKLLKKRYAQLEGQASLLKAKLAEKVDETGKQANDYLDEAKNWYGIANKNASDKWQEKISDLSTGIDNTKKVVKHKRHQAADAITNLAGQAADLVRGDKLEKSTK